MNWKNLKNIIRKELQEDRQPLDEPRKYTSKDTKGGTNNNVAQGGPASFQCYRIDAGDCIQCPKRECNKKTTPCKYRTLKACEKSQTAGSMDESLNENISSCCYDSAKQKCCYKAHGGCMCDNGTLSKICCSREILAGGGKTRSDDDDIIRDKDRIPLARKGADTKIKEATSVTAGNTKFNLRTGVNKNPTKLGVKIQFEPIGGNLDSETKAKLEVALQEKLNTALSEYDIQISKDTDVPRDEVIGFFIPLSQLKNLIIKSLTGKKVADPTVPAPPPEGGGMEPEGEMNEAEGDPCHEDCQRGMWECSCCMCANHGNVNNACHKCEFDKGRGGEKHADSQTKDTLDDTDVEEMIAEQILNEALKVGELNEMSKTVTKEDFYGFINAGQNILRTLDENNIQKGKKYLEYLVKHNII
jgi:hypothetical protein